MKNWQKVGIGLVILLALTLFFWPKECGGGWQSPFDKESSTLEKCSCIGFRGVRAGRQDYVTYCYGICQKNSCATSINGGEFIDSSILSDEKYCKENNDCRIMYGVLYDEKCSAGCFNPVNVKASNSLEECKDKMVWEPFTPDTFCECINNKCELNYAE